MKSIKPGRGPSMKGFVMSIAMALFGVLWTIAALAIGGGFFALFGVIFIGIAVYEAVYNYRNATSKNRYSTIDIVDSCEEGDPLNEKYGRNTVKNTPAVQMNGVQDTSETNFCPYCGKKVGEAHSFCSGCGKKLP